MTWKSRISRKLMFTTHKQISIILITCSICHLFFNWKAYTRLHVMNKVWTQKISSSWDYIWRTPIATRKKMWVKITSANIVLDNTTTRNNSRWNSLLASSLCLLSWANATRYSWSSERVQIIDRDRSRNSCRICIVPDPLFPDSAFSAGLWKIFYSRKNWNGNTACDPDHRSRIAIRYSSSTPLQLC